MLRRDLLLQSAALVGARVVSRAKAFKAGVAKADITPRESLWMAGFAARKQASQGTAQPLHVKALAFDDGGGRPAVLVTVDLLGVTREMSARIAEQVSRRHRLPRARLLINASHTHCGPVVDGLLSVAYDLDAAQLARIRDYTRALEAQIVGTIGAALDRLEPVSLGYGVDEAPFAANRRVQFTPNGPVDRRVPVLRVDSADGRLRAVVFGYACHNTTLQPEFVEFHGDYAGVAQAALETRHAGATAMFVAGCGADANPAPRGTRPLVEQHGTALADAVDRALPRCTPVAGPISAGFDEVDLPFAPFPDADGWRARLADENVYVKRHAQLMLDLLKEKGRLQRSQPDPVQVWRFGGDLTLVALGGEVVVDYALRLGREHPGRLWVAGYSNDVFGYVPSRRVLEEGGYEGGGAMIYYGRPGPFDSTVEERIIAAVNRMVRG
jgi:hypothetical protein